MRDYTQQMFTEEGWLRLTRSNGFTWYGHLAEAVVGACEGSAQAREYHMEEAVMSYVASLQRLKLAMEPVYVAVSDDDIRAHVAAAAPSRPASFDGELDACLPEFKTRAVACMVEIIPNLASLDAADFNLVSNGYVGVCRELPWGTGAMFIQAGYAAGHVKAIVSCPTKLEYHWRPRETPSVDMIEESLAGYRLVTGQAASAGAPAPHGIGDVPFDDEQERLALEEQMMRF